MAWSPWAASSVDCHISYSCASPPAGSSTSTARCTCKHDQSVRIDPAIKGRQIACLCTHVPPAHVEFEQLVGEVTGRRWLIVVVVCVHIKVPLLLAMVVVVLLVMQVLPVRAVLQMRVVLMPALVGVVEP